MAHQWRRNDVVLSYNARECIVIEEIMIKKVYKKRKITRKLRVIVLSKLRVNYGNVTRNYRNVTFTSNTTVTTRPLAASDLSLIS